MRILAVLIMGICLLLFTVEQASGQSASSWNTYQNARFGYEIGYPGDFHKEEPPPENNDGRIFTSSDGKATITVYGSFNALSRTIAGMYRSQLDEYSKEGKTVTYKARGDNWFVLSGFDGDRIFYIKTLRKKADKENEVYATIIFYYPRASKNTYDAVTERLSKSLRFVKHPL